MLDSNLFKEAIADAKAVRRTALANAKVALEEAFSEKYQAMFSEKLKEDAAMGDVALAPAAQSAGSPMNEIDELIKELEDDMSGEQPPVDEPEVGGAEEVPGAEADLGAEMPPMPAAPAAAPAPDMGAGAAGPSTPAPAGFAWALIQVDGAAGASPAPAPVAPPMPPAAPDMGAEMPPAPDVGGEEMPPVGGEESPIGGEEEKDETDETINLDELLESLKNEIECDDKKEEVDEAKLASSAIGGKVGGSDNKKPSTVASKSSGIESGGASKDGYPSGGATTTATDATEAKRPNQGANVTKTNLSTPSKGGEAGPALKAARPNCKGEFENTAKINEENAALKTQLNEAESTIKFVKSQLNEVNLLNAKLLYTNKLFKGFNMSNEQKMRIVEMFDLSQSVREVKMTFANISKSLNFGDSQKKPATASPSVQSITEGLASRQVGSTKPSSKEIISESRSAMVSQFQKLAGIKKK